MQHSTSEDVHPNFNELTCSVRSFLQDIFYRCISLYFAIDHGDLYIIQNTWSYLNLAVKSSLSCNWKKHIFNQNVSFFPHNCKDYLLGERKLPPCSMLLSFYEKIIALYQYRLTYFPCRVSWFYPDYERMFYKEIPSVTNNALRRLKIKKYLDVCRLCGFEGRMVAMYDNLLVKCTSPPVDPDLTIGIVDILVNNAVTRRQVFEFVPDEITLEVLLWHAKEKGFDFWGLWQGKGGISNELNPVVDYLISETKISFAKILLKYGFQYVAPQYLLREYFVRTLPLRYMDNDPRRLERLRRIPETMNFQRLMLMLITFATFADPQTIHDKTENISTLVCVTRTIPEPYITPVEIFSLLRCLLNSTHRVNLESICDEYKNAKIYDGEDYDVYEPRSLLHLSRCKIRSTLADNMNLPEGIELLNLPYEVQRYLELEK